MAGPFCVAVAHSRDSACFGQLSTARVYRSAKVWAPWNLEMHEHSCVGDQVDVYCVERIVIGANSTVSQYSYLCGATHDHEDPSHPLVPLPITIGTRVWIAADVFVAPGITIGDGTVVGVRSTVLKDLPEWVVAVGTPAKPVHAPRPRRALRMFVCCESRASTPSMTPGGGGSAWGMRTTIDSGDNWCVRRSRSRRRRETRTSVSGCGRR
jgi:acetyltransferase-like isoleucine patch superfamily enzyme